MSSKRGERPFGRGEAWLGKRAGSDSFYIFWFDARSRQTRKVTTKTADPDKAHKAFLKWMAVHGAMTQESPSQVPLALVLDRYYEQHASKKKSRDQAKTANAKWKKFFGPIAVSELSIARQEEFIEHLSNAGYAANYIRRTLSVGQSALIRAVRRQELASAPAIVMPPRKRTKKSRMSLQEVAALFNAARTEHFRMYLILAFLT